MKNKVWAAVLFALAVIAFVAFQKPPADPCDAQVLAAIYASPNASISATTGTPVTIQLSCAECDADPSNHRAFIDFKDGTFYNGNWITGGAFPHTYVTAGAYTVDAEATAAYNDKRKPKALTAPPTVTVTGSTVGPNPLAFAGPTGSVSLEQARLRVVPCQLQTYVVTVKNPCEKSITGDVTLSFDPNIMVVRGGTTASYPSQTVPGGQQRHFIFRLEATQTATASIGQQTTISGAFTPGEGGGQCLSNTTSTTTEPIAESHDPNRKTWARPSIISAVGEEIEFKIEVQNDGSGAATHIVIEDILDQYLDEGSFNFNPATDLDPRFTATLTPPNATDRKASWIISGSLPGLGDPSVSPEKTICWLKFRVKTSKFKPCSAICNQAWVRFDCNPPFVTNMAIVPMRCTPDAGDSIKQDCKIVADLRGDSLPSMLNAIDKFFAPGDDYKWYPHTGIVGVDGWTKPSPAFSTPLRKQDYILIASKSCERGILHHKTDPCGGFKIVETTPSWTWPWWAPPANRTFTVAGTANLANIEWSRCVANSDKDPIPGPVDTRANPAPGVKEYVGAYDPASGCAVEIVIEHRKGKIPIWVFAGALVFFAFWGGKRLLGRRQNER